MVFKTCITFYKYKTKLIFRYFWGWPFKNEVNTDHVNI